jgi:Lar family restriction alleviation protein
MPETPAPSREPLPCPFCAGVDVDMHDGVVVFWVSCTDCGCEGPIERSARKAVSSWNRRPHSHRRPASDHDCP